MRRMLAALLLCAASVSACSSSDDSVKFGYIADFNGASLIAIAQEKGLWAKNGLTVEAKPFTNGPLQVQALGSGDLDFGYVGPGALWLPPSGKAKIVAINSIGLADRVIAQAGVTDLRGKKIGVPEGTSGDMILRLALAKAGLTMNDVEKVVMDPPTIVTAFANKQIDAAGLWYPLVDTIKKQVPDLVEVAKNEDFYPETTFPSAFVARNEVSPELSKKVVKVLREANDLRAADSKAAVATTAAFLKVPADKLTSEAANVKLLTTAELDAATADGTVVGWLTSMNKLFTDFGKLKAAVDPKTYYLGEAYSK